MDGMLMAAVSLLYIYKRLFSYRSFITRIAITADKVLAAAQSFIDLGLADVGYEYLNIDVCHIVSLYMTFRAHQFQDCWMLMSRDSATQQQVPDPSKFPDGMAALADKIHGMGFKIGIYR